MEQQLDVILTGSDGPIEGIVTNIVYDGYGRGYEFKSIDGTLHLVIAKDGKGRWIRVTGTEPYLSGWVDELVEQISRQ
jgi:hypothetical protein